jgi:antitoxin HigA-1
VIKNGMRPIHPGEILLEEYLKPLDLSANAFSKLIRVPANRVSAIVAGSRGITADTALRLGRVLGTTPQFWLNLQQAYDLRVEETKPDVRREIGLLRALRSTEPAPAARTKKAAGTSR